MACNVDKYGDCSIYESYSDCNIFFPIAKLLITPLHDIGLTPNMVTILSTCITLSTIYFLSINRKDIAILTLLGGYIFDCVDGMMARKYKMTSDLGMALDSSSDIISNGLIILFLATTYVLNTTNILLLIIIFIFSYMLTIAYGMVESVASIKATESANFYKRRREQLAKYLECDNDNITFEKLLYKFFLIVTKFEYDSFKKIFPMLNQSIIDICLPIIKNFGPGNYTIILALVILLIK